MRRGALLCLVIMQHDKCGLDMYFDRSSIFPQMNLLSFGTLDKEEEDGEGEEVVSRVWYTSADDFKPLKQRFYSRGYKESYYAYSLKTNEHLVVKKYIRGKRKGRVVVPLNGTLVDRVAVHM